MTSCHSGKALLPPRHWGQVFVCIEAMIIDHPSAFQRPSLPQSQKSDEANAIEPSLVASTYDDWRAAGLTAVERGDFDAALECFELALERARLDGDDDLVDLAVCNRAAVRIELGDGLRELEPLRTIVTRSRRAQTRWLAAYSASRIYELEKRFKKSLFYARIAKNLTCDVVDRIEWRASSFNQVGNLLLAESYVEEAEREYRTALELIPKQPEEDVWRARVLDNLGYCCTLLGKLQEAFEHLRTSVAILADRGAEPYEVAARISLSYALLEAGDYSASRAQSDHALHVARRLELDDAVKNALYLLGHASLLDGHLEFAEDCFDELVSTFYPDQPEARHWLQLLDVGQLVNLKA